jgi:TrmH family RNA methyltransferase
MIERITSAQNPKIKHLLALQEKSRLRREEGLFVVEGRRELEHCLAAGFQIDTLFLCPEICPEFAASDLLASGTPDAGNVAGSVGSDVAGSAAGRSLPASDVSLRSTPPLTSFTVPPLPMPRAARSSAGKDRPARVFHLSKELYAKVAYRGGTEGVIAEVRWKERSLDELLTGKDSPLIMVMERVEKPGNLGAVLRSADAAGADGVILCDPLTDLYNPNLIRASIGAIFTVPVVACTSAEAIAWLKANNIRILTAQLQDSAPYYDVDMTCGTALVMGTEATGLTDAWRQAADAHILIPMLGRLDSLNVSVSAAILLYEAVRQRQR